MVGLMPTHPAEIGMCFPRTFPPSLVAEFARKLDEGGADQLWIIEDCFYTAGVSLAAAALSVTERLRVGLGILPTVARNPAVTAMEIATLSGLGPGRVIPGLGHGVQSWMAQMGAKTPSPLTTLDEVMTAVRRLLAGETVTVHGSHVHLDEVALDQPPAEPPPLLAGVMGPKSMSLAGRIADGVVLAEPAGPSTVRWALDRAGRPDDFHVAVFAIPCILDDRRSAYRTMAPWLSNLLASPRPAFASLPFFAEMVDRHARDGVDGLVDMPPEWWSELGPIGTMDDALAHLDALEAAGARSIALFPAPDVGIARAQLGQVLELAAR
jgi:5,10-methylenetetrahydromethanopterin reductase